MHPIPNIIPDCQSPANDAAGVVAAKPDAGGGVGTPCAHCGTIASALSTGLELPPEQEAALDWFTCTFCAHDVRGVAHG